jgi:hypothetical protein
MNTLYYVLTLLSLGVREEALSNYLGTMKIENHPPMSQVKTINHNTKKTSLSIYPNPATTEIKVQLDEKIREGVVFIFNTSGKAEMTFGINQVEEFQLPLNLKPGYYILRVTQQEESKQSPFLVY